MQKCTICGEAAPFVVKGTTTFYCETHAIEFFGDITYLVKAEDEAQRMKSILTQDAE